MPEPPVTGWYVSRQALHQFTPGLLQLKRKALLPGKDHDDEIECPECCQGDVQIDLPAIPEL